MMINYRYVLPFLLCIVFNCSKNTVDEGEDIDIKIPENPVVFEYDRDRDNAVQEKWEEFIDEYYDNKTPQSVTFDPITSYLQDLQFSPSYPLIFRFPFTQIHSMEISEKMMEFYIQWQDLFGCTSDNLENDIFTYNSATEEMTVSFRQLKLSSSEIELADNHGIEFRINKQGQLIYLVSNLIPDLSLKEPAEYDSEAILQNIYGDSVTFYYYANQYTYVFSDSNSYNLLEGYQILVNYEDNRMYVYAAKPVNVSVNEFPNIYFIFYANPETSAIIQVRKRNIF